eukprot:9488292-Pyramimonas_sp.AAC.2
MQPRTLFKVFLNHLLPLSAEGMPVDKGLRDRYSSDLHSAGNGRTRGEIEIKLLATNFTGGDEVVREREQGLKTRDICSTSFCA